MSRVLTPPRLETSVLAGTLLPTIRPSDRDWLCTATDRAALPASVTFLRAATCVAAICCGRVMVVLRASGAATAAPMPLNCGIDVVASTGLWLGAMDCGR